MGMSYLNITDDLNAKGRRLPIGKVLIFDYEGSPVYLKIMRKKDGKVWAKKLDPAKFLTPKEADKQVVVKRKNL